MYDFTYHRPNSLADAAKALKLGHYRGALSATSAADAIEIPNGALNNCPSLMAIEALVRFLSSSKTRCAVEPW